MPHDVLVDLVEEMNESGSNWEHRARVYRGFLRVTRAGMEDLLETNPIGNDSEIDWRAEYQELAASISDILKGNG